MNFNFNKCPILLQDVDIWQGGGLYMGAVGKNMESLKLSLHFCCEPKTSRKIVYLKEI